MPERLQQRFGRFPWATFGRPELAADFFEKIAEQRSSVRLLPGRPLFSLVAPLGEGVPEAWLDDFTAACRLQSYPDWELVLVGSGARAGARRAADSRITGIEPSRQASEAGKREVGLERARGEWVVFLDPRDVPSPALLYRLACRLPEGLDGYFANEAWLSEDGRSIDRFLSKPDPSWFNFLHFDAVGSPWAARRTKLLEWAPLGAGVFLRALDSGARLARESQYLVYRRSRSEWDAESQARAARESLGRRGLVGNVLTTARGNTLRVDVVPDAGDPLVTAIVCFRDKADWVIEALDGLSLARGKTRLELVLVDNESRAAEAARVQEAAAKLPFPAKVVSYPFPFHFGEMNNWAVREHAKGDLLLLLNNDVFWKTEGGLERLAAWAAQPWVGTVGMRLVTPSGKLQYGGLRARFGGGSRLARLHHVRDEEDFALENHVTFANTFAACCLKRSLWEELGGFRKLDLANGYGDVAFNFECVRQGLENLYLGSLEAVHLESGSRGNRYEYWEECLLESEYPDILGRMLRDDLGYDRVPEAGLSAGELLRNGVVPWITSHAPWLAPLKRTLRQSRWVQSLFG